MFNVETFESLVTKAQESSLAAAGESDPPFVSAGKRVGAMFSNLKSKLSFSDPDGINTIGSSQSGRTSRNKKLLLDDPSWKEASTAAEKTTVAVNILVRFFGPIIDQINNFGEVLKHFRERLEVVEK